MRSFDRTRLAPIFLRASYVIFAGFILMVFMGLFADGISGGELSVAGPAVLYVFAVSWQAWTVMLNRNKLVPWILLIGYLGFVAIPLIGSLFSEPAN